MQHAGGVKVDMFSSTSTTSRHITKVEIMGFPQGAYQKKPGCHLFFRQIDMIWIDMALLKGLNQPSLDPLLMPF